MRVIVVDFFDSTIPYDKQICRSLAKAGLEVAMLGSQGSAASWDCEPVSYIPAKLVDRPEAPERIASKWMRRVNTVYRLLALTALLRKRRPDVVHFQWVPFSPVFSLFVKGLRLFASTVLTVHDSVPENDRNTAGRLRSRWKQTLGCFDHLIVHTATGRRHLQQARVRPPIAIVPHGPLELGATDRTEPASTREQDVVEFLLFGRIKPYKGVDVLIRAVAQIGSETRSKCRFVVAGLPEMNTQPLKDLARSLAVEDSIVFIERYLADSEVADLFNRADALVFPYRQIDVSGVLMLSLSVGRAVIASDIGAFSETLEDGKTALLVPPDAPDELARALARLATDRDLRRTLAHNIQNAAASTWDDIAESTCAVYQSAIRTRSSAGVLRRTMRLMRTGASEQRSS